MGKLCNHVVVFLACHSNGAERTVRIRIERESTEGRDSSQSDVPGSQAELCFNIPLDVNGRTE